MKAPLFSSNDRGLPETDFRGSVSYLGTQQGVVAKFLELVQSSVDAQGFVESATAFFYECSGCDSVGIRLRSGEDYPYSATQGFSQRFIDSERSLYAGDRGKCPLRDSQGTDGLQCLCGALLTGGCALVKDRLTPEGAFYSNDFASFVGGISKGDQASYGLRNHCLKEGSLSVAIFPLVGENGRFGLLHLHSKASNHFTPEFLSFWEWLAAKFSVALQRFQFEEAQARTHHALGQQLAERATQLQNAEAALHENEMLFRQMAESVHDVFWLIDLEGGGRIVYLSPACQEIFGVAPKEFHDHPMTWLAVIHKADRKRVRKSFVAGLAGGAMSSLECRIVHPDGAIRWISNEGTPALTKDGRVVRMRGVIRDITENKQLQKELLGISEREQRRIAEELHDSLCQHLAGTALLSSALLKKLQAKQDPVAPEVARICALLTTAVNETRHLSHGLYPVRSEEGGLAAALGRLAMTISALFPICCLFRASGTTNIFDETVATHLYRIAQEAVSNAIKHGEAEQVTLKLQEKGGQILLTIRDNGCGFPERLPASHGIGLRIMTRRASEIGGCLQVNRGKRSGTVVSCSIPVA